MFGLYRLILALVVASSHFGAVFAGFNPGQWSVICFYLLSGFLMSRQFKKLNSLTTAFYLDRFLRIVPLYWVVVLLAMIAKPVPWPDFWLNFLLIPTDFESFHPFQIIVGPAWSLACEAQFYLLVPLLALARTRTLHFLMGGSVLLFCLAPLLEPTAFWAYGGLPGVLFTFLTGILIEREDWSGLRLVYVFLIVVTVICLTLKITAPTLRTGILINICIGYIIALPMTGWLSRKSPKVQWDQMLGLLSFPLFLIHAPIRDVAYRYFSNIHAIVLLMFSIAASVVLVLAIEKPFDYVRRRARGLIIRESVKNSA